jgi:hypothetical protein
MKERISVDVKTVDEMTLGEMTEVKMTLEMTAEGCL